MPDTVRPERSRAEGADVSPPARNSIGHLLEQAPGDDEPLNLGRALADLANLRVAHHSLDRIVARVAVAAVHLNGLERRPHGDLRAEELRHCRFLRERLALLGEPRGVKHEMLAGFD